jgi:uncharacterized protein
MTGRGQPHRVDAHGDPLTLALSGFLAEPAGSVREYEIAGVEVDPGDGLHLDRAVSGRVRLSRTNRGIVVDARLETAIGGECARCLRPASTRVSLRIDEEVLPSVDLVTGTPVPLEEGADPEATSLTDHHELELRPLVEEAIRLVEPIAPLCEPDCPGLCPDCGRRLSDGHGHEDDELDPRLEVLRAFRVDATDDPG